MKRRTPKYKKNAVCPKTKKTRYKTETDARLHLAWIKTNSANKKVPVRAYFCDRCNGWHLTSED